MAVRAKARRVPRRISADIKRPVRSFSIATGELLWASNQLHTAFSVVFAVLVSRENLAIGSSIWHVAPSESVQRQMLAALVDVKFKKKSKMHAQLTWAKNKADKLATIRNDAAHMSTAFRTDSKRWELVANSIGNTPTRARRLDALSDLQLHFRIARADLVQLSGFVYALFFRMVSPDANDPWPRKPALQSV
jgi:hypothetical protein